MYITALVLKVLSSYNGTFDLQTEIDNTVTFLLTNQNPDGGFPSTGLGQDPSTVYATALVFDALIASGADISAIAPSAIDYLITTQLPNGSWNDDPYSTALAIRALANVKPNLYPSPHPTSPSQTQHLQSERRSQSVL